MVRVLALELVKQPIELPWLQAGGHRPAEVILENVERRSA
jgi:hypothetical protein